MMRRKNRGNRRLQFQKDETTADQRHYHWVIDKAIQLCQIKPWARTTPWFKEQLGKLRSRVFYLMERANRWRNLLRANSHVRALCHHEVAHFSQAITPKRNTATNLPSIAA